MDCKMVKAEMTLRSGAPRRIAWERGECSTNSRRDREQRRGRWPPSRRTAQTSGRPALEPLSDSVATRLAPREAG